MEAHPTRTFVMQILRLIVWVVIAIALIKFAFFPTQPPQEELVGQGVFELPTVTVSRGDIENTISLDASIIRNASTPAKATSSGEVVWFYVGDGANVGEGAPIIQVMKTETKESTDPEQPPQTWESYHDVYAQASGTLSLSVLEGQQVQIGEQIGTITPDSFHVEVAITPDKLYSLNSLPKEATVAITDGPAPFTCTNLRTITTATSSDPNSGGAPGAQSGPQLRCEIPSDQTVYDGLKAKLEIAGGSATNALIIPVSAVEGRFREGNVYLPATEPGGKPEKKTVKLGVSDGKYIEVLEGLAEGETILEFVPRKSNDDDENLDKNGNDSSNMQG